MPADAMLAIRAPLSQSLPAAIRRLDTMNAHHLRLVSPLSPTECVARLNGSIDIEPSEISMSPSLHGTHDFIGLVKDDALRLRRRLPYSSLFQPRLEATITAHGGGAMIEGAVAMSGAGRTFVGVWWALAGFISSVTCLGAVLLTLRRRGTHWGVVPGLAAPFVVILAGGMVAMFSRRRLRAEAELITGFVRETLNAIDAP